MNESTHSSIVSKCVIVLDLLVRARKPLSYSEIILQSGFSKSSGHRILSVLQGENLVRYDERSRRYAPGRRLLGWAQAAWRNMDLQQASATELEFLLAQSGLNVAMGMLDDTSVLYLRTMDTLHVRFAAKAGDHAPLHCTAIGKVLLAWQPDACLDRLITQMPFERHTEFSITEPDLLREHLKAVRQQGYAIADREEVLQVRGIAAPIFAHEGKIVGAVSIWGPLSHADLDKLQSFSSELTRATASISEKMGGCADL